ncbi:MAG: hypothetical protein KDA69_08480 [Planctomycetaceae bacterium]|nr:hypothetical protein [Planctomycetaceae bacterium]
MFKLPGHPSRQASVCELADFMELWAMQERLVSCTEVLRYLGRIDENFHNEGCEDDDSDNALVLDDVLNELDRRSKACRGGYPFSLSVEGTRLRHQDSWSKPSSIYRYLLLSTRLNMLTSKVHGGIDGTELMEVLSAIVLKCYLGKNADSLVFGTALSGSFEKRVDTLCKSLGECGGFHPIDPAQVTAKDDKLDAVAWIPFPDEQPGQLIVFAQCKTGTNWQTLSSQLQPEAFGKRWLRRQPLVPPMRAFCVAEVQDPTRWQGACLYAGILFDRCRLVAFSDQVAIRQFNKWSRAALKSFRIVDG